jgi:hypothetical protein
LTYSGLEDWFSAEAAEGNPIAIKGLNSRPEIPAYLEFIWEAFWQLSGDRQYGAMGGVGPIPFSSLDRYADRYGVSDPDQFDSFVVMIRALDVAYINHVSKSRKS